MANEWLLGQWKVVCVLWECRWKVSDGKIMNGWIPNG